MDGQQKKVRSNGFYQWGNYGRRLIASGKWIGVLLLAQCIFSSALASSSSEDNYSGPKLPTSRLRRVHPLGNSVQLRPADKDYRFPLWAGGSHVLPSFDKKVERNVTTQLGQTGYLHCVVNNLGDKTVSWIRRKDFHVLTVGLDTYTSEDRFEAVHVSSTNDWALKIKYADIHDSGTYECQVSSDPKISFFVNLNVVVAVARILGAPDLFVRKGSAINLTCIISQSPEPPRFVFWYHDDRMINYDATKAEINVQKAGDDTAISRLYIRSGDIEDSGNYTCCPSNAEATSISVVVLLGEKPAAMQHDSVQINSSSKKNSGIRSFICLLLWTIFPLWRLSVILDASLPPSQEGHDKGRRGIASPNRYSLLRSKEHKYIKVFPQMISFL